MNNELKNQIECMAEDFCSKFMDAYQCMDWGITAQQFAKYLIDCFSAEVQEYAAELDSEDMMEDNEDD